MPPVSVRVTSSAESQFSGNRESERGEKRDKQAIFWKRSLDGKVMGEIVGRENKSTDEIAPYRASRGNIWNLGSERNFYEILTSSDSSRCPRQFCRLSCKMEKFSELECVLIWPTKFFQSNLRIVLIVDFDLCVSFPC